MESEEAEKDTEEKTLKKDPAIKLALICRPKGLHLILRKVGGARLLREKRPHRRQERRGGSRTDHGKRVTGVEIHAYILHSLKKM